MNGLILSDFTELFIAIIVFGVLASVVFIVIGNKSEAEMNKIFEAEWELRHTNLEHHKTN